MSAPRPLPWPRRRPWIVVVCGLMFLCEASAQRSALDLDGRAVDPLVVHPGKAAVLIFVRRDCPVSGRYAPLIQKISQQYAARASFWLVFPDKTDSSESIRDYMREYGYQLPALRDPAHVLVKLGHVQITPEVAVFDPRQRLVYDGRIDNWYVEFGRARPSATTHELEDAIRAATGNKAVAKSEVRGVGCYVSDLE